MSPSRVEVAAWPPRVDLRQSHAYDLGERSYLVEDSSDGKVGMLAVTTAVIIRAMVDRAEPCP